MTSEVPEYAYEPVKRFLRSLYQTYRLLDICMRGVATVSNYPKMTQRIVDLTQAAGEEITEELLNQRKEAEKLGSFAENELKNEFSSLHAFGIVAIWGAIEIAVEDLLVGIMINESTALTNDAISRIRIPLAKFEILDREERMRFLLAELSRSQAGVSGVDAFEELLQVFGLSGKVDDTSKRLLWEMNHVRNVIVHRDSHADSRLVHSCPWLGLGVGDRVKIECEKFGEYVDALRAYVGLIEERLRARYSSKEHP